MKQSAKLFRNHVISIVFVFAMLCFCSFGNGVLVQAADESGTADDTKAKPVSIKLIDYEQGILQIDTNNNTKVFYSDSAKKTWNVIEGKKDGSGILTMDISWISAAKDYELNLKGSNDETVVTVELPKYNSALKVKFDKVDGSLEFSNEEGATEFEWRKSAAINAWTRVPMEFSTTKGQEFLKEMEAMRVRGGKIQVRIPQSTGESEAKVGSRPSKIITVSITKRGSAPSVKVTANSMNVNTTDKMEYKLISVGGNKQTDTEWTECEKKMYLADMVPQVITVSGGSVGKNVMVAIRKTETEKVPYSKSTYLTIPAQPKAPDSSSFTTSRTSSKFSLSIGDASQYRKYQYAIVAEGERKEERQFAWRTVSNTKAITFSKSKYPDGSTIYVRTQGENLSKKSELKLPSAYTTVSISYLTETKE